MHRAVQALSVTQRCLVGMRVVLRVSAGSVLDVERSAMRRVVLAWFVMQARAVITFAASPVAALWVMHAG